MQIQRVALEFCHRGELEHVLVRRFEHDLRRLAGLTSLDPAQHVQAPTVAGLEAAKPHFTARRDEIVAAFPRELEKLRGDLHADEVRHALFAVGCAAAVAKITRYGIVAAGKQRAAENVLLVGKLLAHAGYSKVIEDA